MRYIKESFAINSIEDTNYLDGYNLNNLINSFNDEVYSLTLFSKYIEYINNDNIYNIINEIINFKLLNIKALIKCFYINGIDINLDIDENIININTEDNDISILRTLLENIKNLTKNWDNLYKESITNPNAIINSLSEKMIKGNIQFEFILKNTIKNN